jgi:hypothetical protein
MQHAASLLPRLLRVRAAAVAGALLALATLAGCDDPQGPGTVPAVHSVEISQRELLLAIGANQQLAATLKAADGRTLSGRAIAWSSSDTVVATVTAGGAVTARGPGSARIIASSEGKSDTAQVAVANPAPTITALSPALVEAGGPAFTLTVTGTGFLAGSYIRWNGSVRLPTQITATELRVEVPSSDIAVTQAIQVTVHNPAPGGGISSPLTLLVVTGESPNPPPQPGVLAPAARQRAAAVSRSRCWAAASCPRRG